MLINKKLPFLLLIISIGCTSKTNNTEFYQFDINDSYTSSSENQKEHLVSDSTLEKRLRIEQDVEVIKSASLDSTLSKDILQSENFHDYINLTKFLSTHVSTSGNVNYNSIVKDRNELNSIIN